MSYEIWHTPSGSALSEHATREAALEAVREVLELDGHAVARELTLLRVQRRGGPLLVASGDGLIALLGAHVA